MSSTEAGLGMSNLVFLAMLGAALNWRIVSRSGKFFNMVLGDTVARVIYVIVGAIIFCWGSNNSWAPIGFS